MPLPRIARAVLPEVEGRPFHVHVVSLLAKENLSFSQLFQKVSSLGVTRNVLRGDVIANLRADGFIKTRFVRDQGTKKTIGYEYRLLRPFLHKVERFDPPASSYTPPPPVVQPKKTTKTA